MPIHTPSPHRFLAPPPPSKQKSKPKSQSGLRHGFTAQTPRTISSSHQAYDEPLEERRVTPAKRFVIAPPSRRTPNTAERSKDRKEARDDGGWAHTQSTFRARLPKPGKAESINESSPSSSANTNTVLGVLPSVEQTSVFPRDDKDDSRGKEEGSEDEEILFVSEERNKRRRVSPQPPSSPTQFTSAHAREAQLPQTPAPATHRFKIPASKPSVALFDNTSTPAPTTSSSRPHFILPRTSPSPSKSATPLPETFSPTRKTGKYIPNGLASTLQSWIIEAADTGYSARNTGAGAVVWGRDKEDGVRMKLRVTSVQSSRSQGIEANERGIEAWAGGVVFVKGVTNASLYNASRAPSPSFSQEEEGMSGEISVMLAGQGGARGKGGVGIREGTVVGIRAPVWDVDVGEQEQAEKWIVGVDWIVLP